MVPHLMEIKIMDANIHMMLILMEQEPLQQEQSMEFMI